MFHQIVSGCGIRILVQVANLHTVTAVAEAPPHAQKQPVAVESAPCAPIGVVEAKKQLVVANQAHVRVSVQSVRGLEKLPQAPARIAATITKALLQSRTA